MACHWNSWKQPHPRRPTIGFVLLLPYSVLSSFGHCFSVTSLFLAVRDHGAAKRRPRPRAPCFTAAAGSCVVCCVSACVATTTFWCRGSICTFRSCVLRVDSFPPTQRGDRTRLRRTGARHSRWHTSHAPPAHHSVAQRSAVCDVSQGLGVPTARSCDCFARSLQSPHAQLRAGSTFAGAYTFCTVPSVSCRPSSLSCTRSLSLSPCRCHAAAAALCAAGPASSLRLTPPTIAVRRGWFTAALLPFV